MSLLSTLDTYTLDKIYKEVYYLNFNDVLRELTFLKPLQAVIKTLEHTHLDDIQRGRIYRDQVNELMNWRTNRAIKIHYLVISQLEIDYYLQKIKNRVEPLMDFIQEGIRDLQE